MRVNTIRTTLNDFIKRLDALSFAPVSDLQLLKEKANGYLVDFNIANLLAFHRSNPVTTVFAHEYESGTIILQDKASCIPATLLDVERGATVLDACAAPGNKTTQLAAIVGRTGQVIAIEKDSKRAMTLKSMVNKAGASECTIPFFSFNVVTIIMNQDFTSLDPQDEQFRQVTHILLDPSCSGSGLHRLDYGEPECDLATRLRNLSTFQTRLIKHALSFPSLQRVVYSTCSIYAEENEHVVGAILKEITGWRVLRRDEQPEGLRNWPRRGIVEKCVSEDVAEGCIRCEKVTDGTIGFFAVGFVRTGYAYTNGLEMEHYEDDEEEWSGIRS